MLCFLKATAGLERLATSRCHEGPGERGRASGRPLGLGSEMECSGYRGRRAG